jgi:hypothetical protein
MKQSDDHTLFAWELNPDDINAELRGPLATSPSMFRECSELLPIPDSDAPVPYSMTNKGLRFELPIVRRNDQKRAMAILQCTTIATYPRRVTLPIVQVNHEDNGHFARDGRYTYPLGSIRLGEIGDAVTRTIFMKQEPEQSVPWRSTFVVIEYNMQRELWSNCRGDALSNRTFLVPTGKNKGAIIYGNQEPDWLVLFNIEMQYRGRLCCKVLRLNSRTISTSTFPRYLRIQSLLSEINEHVISYINRDRNVWWKGMGDIERPLKELHAYYTTRSGSRTSFVHSRDTAVVGDIVPHITPGQRVLGLHIRSFDLSQVSSPFNEIVGDTVEKVRRHEEVGQDEQVERDHWSARLMEIPALFNFSIELERDSVYMEGHDKSRSDMEVVKSQGGNEDETVEGDGDVREDMEAQGDDDMRKDADAWEDEDVRKDGDVWKDEDVRE